MGSLRSKQWTWLSGRRLFWRTNAKINEVDSPNWRAALFLGRGHFESLSLFVQNRHRSVGIMASRIQNRKRVKGVVACCEVSRWLHERRVRTAGCAHCAWCRQWTHVCWTPWRSDARPSCSSRHGREAAPRPPPRWSARPPTSSATCRACERSECCATRPRPPTSDCLHAHRHTRRLTGRVLTPGRTDRFAAAVTYLEFPIHVCFSPTLSVLHRVSKNVPRMACYNFDTHEHILIFSGRNVTDKVSNQKML